MSSATVVVNPPIDDDLTSIKAGDFVIMIHGEDDIIDGQLCRIFDPDEPESSQVYSPGELVPVLCWTG